MADPLERLASVFQKAREFLSIQSMRSALRGLSVLGGGYALAKLISLAEELFVGRYLGVQIYGTYLVILALATILNAVMMLGVPKAVVKIVAERNERITDVPINALFITFFLSIVISLPVIIIGSSNDLLNALGISQYELIFGYAIAFLLTVYSVAQSFKLALYKIRFVVVADIVYWSVALIFFVLFRNLTLGLVGICVGSVLGSVILVQNVPLNLSRISLEKVRSLVPLTIYLGADSVLGLSAQQISVLYLNVIATAYAVGVFGAHYRSSIFLIVPLITVLSMALYPRFCALEWEFRRRVGRYLVYVSVPICVAGFLLSYISGVIFLRIFRVPEIQPLLLLLAAYSGLFVYNRIWDKLITACEGARIVGWGIVFATVAFLSVMVALTPILGGMLAIASGMIANEIIYSAVLLSWFRLRVTRKRRPKTISD
ncbi:MAG TPA: oligosaccharide flippase family protein [Candidatus Bathyarchaeia archaeon]|nr:oligosaccharide flippase family protein [Candidatus Bathyarchaeia archaeon]